MEVHGDDVIRPSDAQHVGHELGGDGRARLVFLVLARIRKARNHRGDPGGTGNLTGVDHDQQFHEIVVHFAASRLHNVDILASNRLSDFDARLLIGELLENRATHVDTESVDDAR